MITDYYLSVVTFLFVKRRSMVIERVYFSRFFKNNTLTFLADSDICDTVGNIVRTRKMNGVESTGCGRITTFRMIQLRHKRKRKERKNGASHKQNTHHR